MRPLCLGVLWLCVGWALAGSVQARPLLVPQDDSVAEEEGERSQVFRLEVYGNARVSREQVLATLGLELGAPLDQRSIERGVRTLWSAFHARVEVGFAQEEDGLSVRVDVTEIPVDFEPRFVGNRAFGLDDIYLFAGLQEGEELGLNEAQRVASRIERRYREDGYAHVEVEPVLREETEDLVADVIFEIREGPRTTIEDVIVRGNQSLPERGVLFWRTGLRAYAQNELGRPWLGVFFKKPYVEEVLSADLVAMSQVYHERGWLDAVVEVDWLEFNEDRSRVTVHLVVDEGPRYKVGSLRVEAIDYVEDPDDPGNYRLEPAELLFPEDELLATCQLTAGEPYQDLIVQEDRGALSRHYGSQGYLAHSSLALEERFRFLDPQLLYDYERREVHVTYRVAQGRQQRLREIRFSGTVHTQDRVVRRLLSVFPGQVADLVEIQRSLARLRGTTWFSDPFNQLNHPEPTFRFVDTGTPGLKDLEIIVVEGQVIRFDISGGAGSSFGLFGSVSLNLENFDATRTPTSLWSTIDDLYAKEAFHGAGQDFQLMVSPGTQISRFLLRFREPDLFRTHLDRIGLDTALEQRFAIWETHDEARRIARLRFDKQLTADSSVYFGVGYQEVDVDDIDGGGEPSILDALPVPIFLAEQEGKSNLSYLEFGWRERVVDQPLSTHDGHDLLAGVQVYSDLWGADHNFVSASLRADYWRPTWEGRDGVPIVAYLGAGAGVLQPFGDTENVPYTERRFLGGLRTLRGFDRRGVGPNESFQPVGGETYFHGTAELRIPLLTTVPAGATEPREALIGMLFADVGVLDPDSFSLDLGETRASIGFGFGMSYPFPILLTFGFPVRDGPGDDKRVFAFSIGF